MVVVGVRGRNRISCVLADFSEHIRAGDLRCAGLEDHDAINLIARLKICPENQRRIAAKEGQISGGE